MVSLTALLSLAGLSLLSVSSALSAASHERFHAIAFYAAESGIAAGTAFLRINVDPDAGWSQFVSASNEAPLQPVQITGNLATPGSSGNPFGAGVLAWYEVTILNNPGDPSFAAGSDADDRVILRSVGHGPNGAVAVVEVEVSPSGVVAGGGRPCPTYAQEGIAEDGAGRNDCLSSVDAAQQAVYRPGSP
jgi:hypothetical protein